MKKNILAVLIASIIGYFAGTRHRSVTSPANSSPQPKEEFAIYVAVGSTPTNTVGACSLSTGFVFFQGINDTNLLKLVYQYLQHGKDAQFEGFDRSVILRNSAFMYVSGTSFGVMTNLATVVEAETNR